MAQQSRQAGSRGGYPGVVFRAKVTGENAVILSVAPYLDVVNTPGGKPNYWRRESEIAGMQRSAERRARARTRVAQSV